MKIKSSTLTQFFYTFLISIFITSCSSDSSDSSINSEPPVINNITVFQATDTTVTLEFNLRKTGTVYYVVQLGGSEPSTEQIKDGTGNGGTVADSGTRELNAGIRRASFLNLTKSTTYTAYVVGEAADGSQTTVGSIEITTLAEPVFRIVDEIPLLEKITIQYETDLAGRLLYMIQKGGITPSKDQIKRGLGNGLGSEVLYYSNVNADVGQNNFIGVNNLTPGTTYKFYLYVENSSTGESTKVISTSIKTYLTNDTTEPVITLKGSTTQNVIVGEAYVEAGATALDNRDGDISDKIIINTARLNTNFGGTYNVTYTVTDSFQNTASVIRTINVIDNNNPPPVINLVGANPQTIEVNTAYTELGATANDDSDGNITAQISIDSSNVNTGTIGSYSVSYSVTDSALNSVNLTRTVNVVAKNIAPVITLLGTNPQTILQGSPYVELNASAADDLDGNISNQIVINANNVNTATPGTYQVSYSVTDTGGKTSSVTRTVNITDAPPVITLLGANPQVIATNDTYTELNATASDATDGDITNQISIDSSAVNTGATGSYSVSYSVTDSALNTVNISRVVNVVNNTAPVIKLLGENPQTILVNTAYTELNATATDDFDGDLTAQITIDISNVNTSASGTYQVSYSVTDSNGATGTVTRTVNVVDTPPGPKPQVSYGFEQSCAIIDNQVTCVGRDNPIGTAIKAIPALTNPRQVSVGQAHACALDDTGVVCWGSNANGQLNVPSLSNPVELASGGFISCATDDSGVVCWGVVNFLAPNGQIANADLNPRNLSLGGNRACWLNDNGVSCVGRFDGTSLNYGPTPDLVNPIDVGSGPAHTCAIDDTGVVCWGSAFDGQWDPMPTFNNPKKIASSFSNHCVIDDDGLSCWGTSFNGLELIVDNSFSLSSLTLGRTGGGCAEVSGDIKCWAWLYDKRSNIYFEMQPGPATSAAVISYTGTQGCTLDEGAVECWGGGGQGINNVTGNTSGSDFHTLVPPLSNPTKISSAGASDCAIDDNGVTCWGAQPVNNQSYTVIQPTLSNPTEIFGGMSGCAIDDSGVTCWGGTFAVESLSLTNPVEISSACAIDDSGLSCSGPTFGIAQIPAGLVNPHGLSEYASTACVIDGSDAVCWGSNLGGVVSDKPALSNPTDLSVSQLKACAVDDNGVTCWGARYRDGEIPNLVNPRQVELSGSFGVCATDDTGVVCW